MAMPEKKKNENRSSAGTKTYANNDSTARKDPAKMPSAIPECFRCLSHVTKMSSGDLSGGMDGGSHFPYWFLKMSISHIVIAYFF